MTLSLLTKLKAELKAIYTIHVFSFKLKEMEISHFLRLRCSCESAHGVIGMNLGVGVSARIKPKIWVHEHKDFGALLSVAPPYQNYSLSMTSTVGASGQPPP